MKKIQNNMLVVFGILMCIAAVTIVLELVNLKLFDFSLLISGLALLLYHKYSSSNFARNIGIALLFPGCAYVCLKILPELYTYRLIIYLVAFLIVLLIFYFLYKKNIFANIGIIDVILVCWLLADKFSSNRFEMYGYVFMAVGAIMLILYFIKSKTILPVLFSLFSYMCGLVNLLASVEIINYNVYSVSCAGILMLAGVTVIAYTNHKTKDKEDKL